jgi:hypothetical protein
MREQLFNQNMSQSRLSGFFFCSFFNIFSFGQQLLDVALPRSFFYDC